MTEGPAAFGSAVRALRNTRGQSLKRLAGTINYSPGYLAKIERGEKPPTLGMAVAIEAALSVAPGTLTALLPPPEPSPRRKTPRPPTAKIPMQLPSATRDFVARHAEWQALDGLLSSMATAPNGASTVVVIDGTAGVGKTSLAVNWAHRVRQSFPDGCLYANLRGFSAQAPAKAAVVLGHFLVGLGVQPSDIPPDAEGRCAQFRTQLDGRQVLLLLDNASSAEQVRPLVPASSGCLVLVTSRESLAGLGAFGTRRVSLGRLAPAEAVGLLRQVTAAERIDAEPGAALELARTCAFLPLALRVVADRLNRRPESRLGDIVAELCDGQPLLGRLADDTDPASDPRTVFSWSYRQLDAPAARMFRMLSLYPGATVEPDAAAVLADLPTAGAGTLLDTLVRCHLLERGSGRSYAFHDLLQHYAAERSAAEDSPNERASARDRLFGWYLHRADAANRSITPNHLLMTDPLGGTPVPRHLQVGFAGFEEALEWCERERTNLLAAVHAAHDCGQHTVAWRIAVQLWGFYYLRKHWADWRESSEVALVCADLTGDGEGQALSLLELGGALRDRGDFAAAVEHYTRALEVLGETGPVKVRGWALTNLGLSQAGLGRHDLADGCHRQALACLSGADHPWGSAWTRLYLGTSRAALGRLEEAVGCYEHAREIFVRLADREGHAECLANLGTAYAGMGQHDRADAFYQKALGVHRETRYQWGEAKVFRLLALNRVSQGMADQALECYDRAEALYAELHDPRGRAECLLERGHLLRDLHRDTAAENCLTEASRLLTALGDPPSRQARASSQARVRIAALPEFG